MVCYIVLVANFRQRRVDTMLFYIDYLDQVTSGHQRFDLLALRLRFDLLIFARDKLCMSVPACIKVSNTTTLLKKLDDFWKGGIIQLQLDEKHKGNPVNYFNNRKKVLSKGMSEEQLLGHFEHQAYESGRPENFFGIYIPEYLSVNSSEIYIGKQHDTDALFREEVSRSIELHYDDICKALEPNRRIIFTGIANRIQACSLDRNNLFQRAVVEDKVVEEFNPNQQERLIVSTILDRAFAVANANTSNAVPISLILNQLTGQWLISLLSKSYKSLYNAICNMDWSEIYALSQDSDWQNFIEQVNAFIYLVQDVESKRVSRDIETAIKKLNRALSLYLLLIATLEKAKDALFNQLYQVGIFSEAQKLDYIQALCLDYYCGKDRVLFDTIRSIENSVGIIEQKIRQKRYSYLLEYSKKQRNKGFEILY